MALGQADAKRHTLLLLQYNNNTSSRTFLDYETLGEALDGLCGLYEKEVRPP